MQAACPLRSCYYYTVIVLLVSKRSASVALLKEYFNVLLYLQTFTTHDN